MAGAELLEGSEGKVMFKKLIVFFLIFIVVFGTVFSTVDAKGVSSSRSSSSFSSKSSNSKPSITKPAAKSSGYKSIPKKTKVIKAKGAKAVTGAAVVSHVDDDDCDAEDLAEGDEDCSQYYSNDDQDTVVVGQGYYWLSILFNLLLILFVVGLIGFVIYVLVKERKVFGRK